MEVNITRPNSDSITIALAGELNSMEAQQFAKDMESLMEEAASEITFDFSKLAYISSAGMRTLLLFNKNAIARGGKVSIIGMSEDIKQIFTLTGFDQMFEIK